MLLLLIWLPVIGLAIVYTVASLLRGSARRIAFSIGPFLVGCTMWWVGDHPMLGAMDGIGRLFALLVYLAGYAAIAIYYVGLLVVAMGSWVRRNAELRSASESH